MADEDLMFSSVYDAATADNLSIRDNATSTVAAGRGMVGAYANALGGGLFAQGLAKMAGWKTPAQKKAELITNVLKGASHLDRNDPKSLIAIARKLLQAGLPGEAQKFMDKARTMTVADRTYGLDVRKTEATEEQVDILRTAEDRAAYEFGKTHTLALAKFDELKYQFKEGQTQEQIVQDYKEKQDAILNKIKEGKLEVEESYLVIANNELNFKEAQSKLDETHRGKVLNAAEMRDAVDKAYKEAMAAAAEVTAEARKTTAESAGDLTENEQEILERKQRNAKAVDIRANWGPTHTVEEKQALLDHLEKEGVADSTVYTSLQAAHSTQRSSELSAEKFDVSQSAADSARIKAEQDDAYKPVVYGTNDGDMMAAGFLRIAGSDMGETEEKTMSGIMGAEIKSYDLALNAERQLDDKGIAEGVTPSEARLGGYYERALAFPGVYKSGEWKFADAAFDSLLFKKVLNKSFSRGGETVSWQDRQQFIMSKLVFPNVTRLVGPDGIVGTMNQDQIDRLFKKYSNQ